MKLSTHYLLGEEIARMRNSLFAMRDLISTNYGGRNVPVAKFTKALAALDDARCVLDDYICRENPKEPNSVVCGAYYRAEARTPDVNRFADVIAQEVTRG